MALDCSAINEEEEEDDDEGGGGGGDYIKNYESRSENKFARHMFSVVSFISNTTIPDLFLLLSYYYST